MSAAATALDDEGGPGLRVATIGFTLTPAGRWGIGTYWPGVEGGIRRLEADGGPAAAVAVVNADGELRGEE